MIVDIAQKGNFLNISYVNEEGMIDIYKVDIYKTNQYGSYDYMICDENDPNKHPTLRHYLDDLPIKRVPKNWLDFDELREFMKVSLPKDVRDKLFSYNPYKLYMVDIEINTLFDDNGNVGDVFPNPHLAEFAIDSIQITGEDLKTLVLSCNDRVFNDNEQRKKVESRIKEHYKDNPYVDSELVYSHIKFKDEKSLIEFFLKAVRQNLHVISFWNGDFFDVPYLWNRCIKLGIDMGLASPTGEVSKRYRWAKHRYVFDYMKLVEENAYDIDRTMFSLEHCASEIVGIGKITKEGDSYKKLFMGDIINFLAYGAVDTISMQLIHKIKNYTTAQMGLVHYCGSTLYEANQVTSQVHCLFWDYLYENNLINAIDYERQPDVKYSGGYVKFPTRKFAMFAVCEDFSALYPRVMQSYNISFENYLGSLKRLEEINHLYLKGHLTETNFDGKITKEFVENATKELNKKGYIITVNNNVYKNDKPYALKVIETKLLGERYDYKGLQQEVFLNIMPIIDKELKERNLHD